MSLKNQTIFLTGFPGFIAGRLVKRLAIEGTRFILLVQPVFSEKACEEVKKISDDCGLDVNSFQIIQGDITQQNFGISPLDYERAKEETTTIFHLAAVYDLAVTRPIAMRVNVEGTRSVNEFALGVKNLRRYHYISTCYVAGMRTGLIKEDELKHNEGFRNFYEETKYLAELEVEALKTQIPITIHRPSVVCGDSKTGETAKYDGIYYVIHYLRKWPGFLSLFNIGNAHVRLNLVPVDFVVDGMTALAKDERAVGATVQLADPAPLTTEQICNTIGKALSGKESLLTIPAPLVQRSLMLPFSPPITGLPHSGVPYFFLQQIYDTTLAQQLLEPNGVRCPSFPSYVEALISFVEKNPKL